MSVLAQRLHLGRQQRMPRYSNPYGPLERFLFDTPEERQLDDERLRIARPLIGQLELLKQRERQRKERVHCENIRL